MHDICLRNRRIELLPHNEACIIGRAVPAEIPKVDLHEADHIPLFEWCSQLTSTPCIPSIVTTELSLASKALF